MNIQKLIKSMDTRQLINYIATIIHKTELKYSSTLSKLEECYSTEEVPKFNSYTDAMYLEYGDYVVLATELAPYYKESVLRNDDYTLAVGSQLHGVSALLYVSECERKVVELEALYSSLSAIRNNINFNIDNVKEIINSYGEDIVTSSEVLTRIVQSPSSNNAIVSVIYSIIQGSNNIQEITSDGYTTFKDFNGFSCIDLIGMAGVWEIIGTVFSKMTDAILAIINPILNICWNVVKSVFLLIPNAINWATGSGPIIMSRTVYENDGVDFPLLSYTLDYDTLFSHLLPTSDFSDPSNVLNYARNNLSLSKSEIINLVQGKETVFYGVKLRLSYDESTDKISALLYLDKYNRSNVSDLNIVNSFGPILPICVWNRTGTNVVTHYVKKTVGMNSTSGATYGDVDWTNSINHNDDAGWGNQSKTITYSFIIDENTGSHVDGSAPNFLWDSFDVNQDYADRVTYENHLVVDQPGNPDSQVSVSPNDSLLISYESVLDPDTNFERAYFTDAVWKSTINNLIKLSQSTIPSSGAASISAEYGRKIYVLSTVNWVDKTVSNSETFTFVSRAHVSSIEEDATYTVSSGEFIPYVITNVSWKNTVIVDNVSYSLDQDNITSAVYTYTTTETTGNLNYQGNKLIYPLSSDIGINNKYVLNGAEHINVLTLHHGGFDFLNGQTPAFDLSPSTSFSIHKDFNTCIDSLNYAVDQLFTIYAGFAPYSDTADTANVTFTEDDASNNPNALTIYANYTSLLTKYNLLSQIMTNHWCAAKVSMDPAYDSLCLKLGAMYSQVYIEYTDNSGQILHPLPCCKMQDSMYNLNSGLPIYCFALNSFSDDLEGLNYYIDNSDSNSDKLLGSVESAKKRIFDVPETSNSIAIVNIPNTLVSDVNSSVQDYKLIQLLVKDMIVMSICNQINIPLPVSNKLKAYPICTWDAYSTYSSSLVLASDWTRALYTSAALATSIATTSALIITAGYYSLRYLARRKARQLSLRQYKIYDQYNSGKINEVEATQQLGWNQFKLNWLNWTGLVSVDTLYSGHNIYDLQRKNATSKTTNDTNDKVQDNSEMLKSIKKLIKN